MDYFERGQTFYDSPQTRPNEGPPTETYRHDYDPQYASYIESSYDYPDQGIEPQQSEAVQTTPPPTPRQTPELFVYPHVRASFGFGGQIVTILPTKRSTCIEISLVKDLVQYAESATVTECVDSFPGPFLAGSTPKNTVVQYIATESKKVREKMTAVSESNGSCLEVKQLEDEALLWEFLLLLCRQNGVILPMDISDMLVKDAPVEVNSTLHLGTVDREAALAGLRNLLLAGQRKQALDMACSNCLWGHALMLADEQSRNYVVNRFTASLSSTDPLGTFYTLLLGQMPSTVKVDGLQRAGDWRQHLAMILANRHTKLDSSAIVSLGDALLSKERLHAAHLCYFLGDVHFGCYGDQSSKYTLLGVEQSKTHATIYPKPQDLRKMEVFEFAMCLSKHDFSLPGFQMYKFLLLLKLVEIGHTSQALKYCEQIGSSVVKGPKQYSLVFLSALSDLSVRLHHLTSPYGVVENELPLWLASLEGCVREVAESDYNPHLFSPSPAFSSVSQTYPQQPNTGQVFFATQGQFITQPTTSGGSEVVSSSVGGEVGVAHPPPTREQTETVSPQEEIQSRGQQEVMTVPATPWEGVAYTQPVVQEGDTLAGKWKSGCTCSHVVRMQCMTLCFLYTSSTGSCCPTILYIQLCPCIPTQSVYVYISSCSIYNNISSCIYTLHSICPPPPPTHTHTAHSQTTLPQQELPHIPPSSQLSFEPSVVPPTYMMDPNQQVVFNQPAEMPYDPNNAQQNMVNYIPTYGAVNSQMTFPPEGTQQMTFQPEGTQQITFQPEGTQQMTFQPDGTQQITFQPEGTQQITFQPEGAQQMTFQSESTEHMTFEPEGTQNKTFVPDPNTLQTNFVPPNNPQMMFNPSGGPPPAPSYWTNSGEEGEGQQVEAESHDNQVTKEETKEVKKEKKEVNKNEKKGKLENVILIVLFVHNYCSCGE